MNTYKSLLRLHLDKYYKVGLIITGVFLVIALFTITIQILLGNSPIYFRVDAIGKVLCFGGIFIFIRGKNGDGKFFSRLPVSPLQLYIVKFVTGIIIYFMVFVSFNLLSEVIAFLLQIVGYKVNIINQLSLAAFTSDFYSFFKGYLFFVFLVSLVLFLERWMSSGEALALIILVPLFISILIPAIFGVFDIDLKIDINSFKSVKDFINNYGSYLRVLAYSIFIVGSAFLYRLRNFKSF